MQKFINTTTTILGLFLIIYIWYLVPITDKFTSMDGVWGTITGLVLVMFRNAKMKDTIYGIIDKFAEAKSTNITKKGN